MDTSLIQRLCAGVLTAAALFTMSLPAVRAEDGGLLGTPPTLSDDNPSAPKDDSGVTSLKDDSGDAASKDDSADPAPKDGSGDSAPKDGSADLAPKDGSADLAPKDGSDDSASKAPKAFEMTCEIDKQDPFTLIVTISGADALPVDVTVGSLSQTLKEGNGLLRFDALAPGDHLITAGYSGSPALHTATQKIMDTEEEKQPEAPLPVPISAVISGGKHLVTAAITDARADGKIVIRLCELSSGTSVASKTGKKGDTITFDAVTPGEYVVLLEYDPAEKDTGLRQSVVVSGDAESGLQAFTMKASVSGTSISGEIFGASNHPVSVSVTPKDSAAPTCVLTVSSGSGTFSTPALAPGLYHIKAFYADVADSPSAEEALTIAAPAANQIAASATVSGSSITVTVTKADAQSVSVRLSSGADSKHSQSIAAGVGSVSFSDLAPAEYTVTVDYDPAQTGSNPVVLDHLVVESRSAIVIDSASAGENRIVVTGFAQPGSVINLGTQPASGNVSAAADQSGRFTAVIPCGAGTYTSVYAQYGAETSTRVSLGGTLNVLAPAEKPPFTLDVITTDSVRVCAKTTPGTQVRLTAPDYTQTASADSRGLLSYTLPHTYPRQTEIAFTVFYGKDNAESYSVSVKVSDPVGYSLLRRGSKSDEVYLLTKRLNDLGYPVTATRSYTDSVAAAVRLFQKANGLDVDGIAGPLTQRALFSLSAIQYDADTVAYPTLVRGDRNLPLIYTLQQRLKDLGYYTIRVDGIFGSGTQRAVRNFQYTNGLSANGIADDATQRLLYSSAAKPASGAPVGTLTTLSRSGRYNPAVVPLQRRLKELGYLSGSADGYFGSKTYLAVRNFQRVNGLSATGKADPDMQRLLYSSSAKAYSASASSSGYRLLYWGCTGSDVARLQSALYQAGFTQVGTADGIFGKNTYHAVCAYQRSKGLSVDGIAGKQTQNALLGTSY